MQKTLILIIISSDKDIEGPSNQSNTFILFLLSFWITLYVWDFSRERCDLIVWSNVITRSTLRNFNLLMNPHVRRRLVGRSVGWFVRIFSKGRKVTLPRHYQSKQQWKVIILFRQDFVQKPKWPDFKLDFCLLLVANCLDRIIRLDTAYIKSLI